MRIYSCQKQIWNLSERIGLLSVVRSFFFGVSRSNISSAIHLNKVSLSCIRYLMSVVTMMEIFRRDRKAAVSVIDSICLRVYNLSDVAAVYFFTFFEGGH